MSTAFLEQYEQHRSHQAAEQLQEKLQLSLDEQNAALDHFSELVTQSNYDEALDEINHLLALDSANPQYYLKRAGLYVLLNRSDEAMADLETTIRLAPDLYGCKTAPGTASGGKRQIRRSPYRLRNHVPD